MPSKFEFNKGKMVPYPSGAIVPDRDLGQRPALECIHLGIEFGGLKAVDDFSLTIGKTEIAGLIGPNGAGKTTVFNLLTKVYQPTHGTILLDGEDTSGKSVYQVNRMGIARTFQNIRLFNTMTVEDNVKVGLHNQERYSGFEGVLRLPTYWKHEKAAHERAMELLSIFDMEHLANEQAGSLPYGAQRRLEIVRALAANPKLLLLDEPAAGMNPSETAELMANIVKIRDTFGIAIMLIEHDMSLVMNICEGINVWYGAIHAIKDISFNVNEGEIVALIGANGAGKSTTLKTVSGLLRSKTGSIKFMGEDITHTPADKLVGKGLAQVPEGRRAFLQMTVEENLEMGAYTQPKSTVAPGLERVYEQFPRLKERRRQVAGTLSGGEQQMLVMGRALMSNPKLLMLDEPSMGLAPILIEQIFQIVEDLHKAGTTVLLVEQNAQMALSIATRGYVLETGKITMTGTGQELLHDDNVRKAYLGG